MILFLIFNPHQPICVSLCLYQFSHLYTLYFCPFIFETETDSPHEPIVVGWGTASGLPQNAHDVPLQFPMPLADQAECREDHARDGFDVTDRMLCAGEGYVLMQPDSFE